MRSATSTDQTSRALVALSVSKIGDISFGRSVGAACFDLSTAASALGKNDARLLLAVGIESSAGPRNNEPHHPKERDRDEGRYCVLARSKETAEDGG